MSNPQSTAKIAGHPIHPVLIPFPIAFFIATYVCDIVYWQTTGVASEGTAAIVPVGLILSLIVVCILGFTGWMGWEMVYRHRVAVAGEMPTGPATATSAPRRAA